MAATRAPRKNKQQNGRAAAKARPASKAERKARTPARKGAAARVRGGEVVRKRRPRFTAATADKYELYQLSVQSPEEDVPFLARVYKSFRKRKALHFREDFCGTGLLSSHWIRQGKSYTAEGFDIDPDPVAWGLSHHFEDIGPDAARYTVHLKDVRQPSARTPDVRVAQNFSYCVFKTRAELLEYFTAAYRDIADDGIFVIDLHGGPEATENMEEERTCSGFKYVWDQDEFWPGTGDYVCYIHFRFRDGTEMKRAFTYRWRMWYLTELRDVLHDAGFATVQAYFEGTDANGEDGDGIFRKGVRGENCESWLAYLVGVK